MSINRREFLKRSLTIAGTSLLSGGAIAHAANNPDPSIFSTGNTANERNWKLWVEKSETLAPVKYGVLVDTTLCIGCRRCEWACNEWNNNPNRPVKEFEASVSQQKSVFDTVRRMHAGN
ncbi:MAG: 4Fe-4S ferredoxin, partial [Thermodesulfovibrionales bacterium]|nr:4Fe-4S ferredoxin [Thermodesulfovibrionales bacterium]